MEDRIAVRTRIARAGQSALVRKDAGLMISTDASFDDLLSKHLSFGTAPIDEHEQVSTIPVPAYWLHNYVQVDILASLTGGGIDVALSSNFDTNTEMVAVVFICSTMFTF